MRYVRSRLRRLPMKQRFSIEVRATVYGFYDPNEESLENAQERIAMKTEMSVNNTGELRMHLRSPKVPL